jgi:RIO kinase 1
MTDLENQERFKTLKGVFDEFTNRTLFELQSRNHFEEMLHILKVGKESNVFVARTKEGKRVIVKIYRMQNCDFNRMFEYIRKDPRYDFLKNHRRQIILAWVQREYKNLIKAERAKVNVPKPIAWRNHILVEEFIGNEDEEQEEAAPALKDLAPKEPKKFFEETIRQIKKLYKAELIHGDLSSFNILNSKEKPVLIDFSQATITRTPNSEDLLRRDIKNVVHYFKKLGIKEEEEKILEKIKKMSKE